MEEQWWWWNNYDAPDKFQDVVRQEDQEDQEYDEELTEMFYRPAELHDIVPEENGEEPEGFNDEDENEWGDANAPRGG